MLDLKAIEAMNLILVRQLPEPDVVAYLNVVYICTLCSFAFQSVLMIRGDILTVGFKGHFGLLLWVLLMRLKKY